MLTAATYVTAISVIFIILFYQTAFAIIKDQIAAYESGVITTTGGVCDKSKSRAKYYSIIVVRVLLIVVLGLIAFVCAAGLNQESNENLINRHIFLLSAILAPVVGLWVFRFREPFRSFMKGRRVNYVERHRKFVQSHPIFFGLVVPAIGGIAIVALRKFW
jgi:hypothetical protein